MQFLSLDQWLDKDHRARIVWAYAESVDLSDLYASIKSRLGHDGRDAIDPRILFALWLLATIEGCTSARRLADLTTRDIAYMWICGGVSVNYHRLSDFRVDHGALLERILVDSIGVLLNQGLVTLQTVAQDGVRVRASAGSTSFRRGAKLDACLQEAEAHLKRLKSQSDKDPSGDERRAKAAAERAVRERVERLARAKEELAEVQQQREKNRVKPHSKEPRASTTDPDARKMMMGDGGYRPAMNVQLASDGDSRLVISVDVVKAGGDQGQMGKMHQKIVDDYGKLPEIYLVDGGFSVKDDIVRVEQRRTKVYGVLKDEENQLAKGLDPYQPKRGDAPEMAAFRARMGTAEGKQQYSRRAGIAEFPNAECRNRGLTQFRVRGVVKAKAQAMWHILAHNFNRLRNLDFLHVVMAN